MPEERHVPEERQGPEERQEKVSRVAPVTFGGGVCRGGDMGCAEGHCYGPALERALAGRLFGPDEADKIGYADALAEDPQATALALASALAAKPGRGVSLTRRRAGDRIADIVDAQEREHREAVGAPDDGEGGAGRGKFGERRARRLAARRRRR